MDFIKITDDTWINKEQIVAIEYYKNFNNDDQLTIYMSSDRLWYFDGEDAKRIKLLLREHGIILEE